MRKKKLFIMGCGGMLGKAYYEKLHNSYDIFAYDIDVNEEWLQYGDIRDYNFCKQEIAKVNPDLIINLAADTSLERCEQDPINAYKTNTLGAEILTSLAKKSNTPFIHISTAGVFDGTENNYTEYHQPKPISVYGKSKYEAEKIVLGYKNAFIFRAGWMMGGGKKDKKFVKLITDQINQGSKTIYAVTDKLGTPTYTNNFVETTMNVINSDVPCGLYHVVCGGTCSRYDVAKAICNFVDPNIEVKPVDSSHFKKTYFADRPPDEGLITLKLDSLNLNKMKHWKICLTEYLTEIYK